MKKHIIFSSFDDYTSNGRGGTANSIHQFSSRLSKNYRITVLAARNKNSVAKVIDGVTYEHIGITFGDIRFRQFIFFLILPFYVMTRKYDMWVENFTGPFSVGFLPLFTKKPVIGVGRFFNADSLTTKYYGLPFDKVEKFGFKFYKYFVALSDFQLDRARAMNAKTDIAIISNAHDPHMHNLVRTKETKKFMYIGRFDNHTKGFDLMIAAVAPVLKKHPDFELVMAGQGEPNEVQMLQETIKKYGIESQVKFPGFILGEGKYKLYEEAMVYLATSRYETFGGAICESLAAGLPLIIFDLPCFSWLPRDCSLRAPAFDVQKYSEAIETLVNDKQLRLDMGARGRKFAETLSWDSLTEKYVAYFEKIIKENNL